MYIEKHTDSINYCYSQAGDTVVYNGERFTLSDDLELTRSTLSETWGGIFATGRTVEAYGREFPEAREVENAERFELIPCEEVELLHRFEVGDTVGQFGDFGGYTAYTVEEVTGDRLRVLLAETWQDVDGAGTRPAQWHDIHTDRDGHERVTFYTRDDGTACGLSASLHTATTATTTPTQEEKDMTATTATTAPELVYMGDASLVRSYCIKNGLYTRGTCSDYAGMLEACEVETTEPVTLALDILDDILEHSNRETIEDRASGYGMSYREFTLEVMLSELLIDCMLRYIRTPEERNTRESLGGDLVEAMEENGLTLAEMETTTPAERLEYFLEYNGHGISSRHLLDVMTRAGFTVTVNGEEVTV